MIIRIHMPREPLTSSPRRPPIVKSAVIAAILLATLPFWILPVMAVPMPGFLGRSNSR